MLFDSHCHLQAEAFAGEVAETVERARAAGVTRMAVIGWDLASSAAALRLAEQYDGLVATVGIAPHDETRWSAATHDALRELARHPRCAAIGECGLDYHYNTWPRDIQRAVFESQLALAVELGKPVVIHCRDAQADTLDALRAYSAATPRRPAGVMHCFSGDVATAQACAALGFLISIAGPVTYRNPRDLPDVARTLPLDALLVETDAPFLAPQSKRGKRNEPAYVRETSQKVADLRGEPLEVVGPALSRNAARLFGLASG